MAVCRIVANIDTPDPAGCAAFYQRVFGLAPVMDHGWIVTLQAEQAKAPVQLSLAAEGGSAQPVPALSIEVDDLDEVLTRLTEMGQPPTYGPVKEPWGVRRLFVTDPAGTLINILSHAAPDAADRTGD
ncbi:VOC family protein [Thalassovita taeanensis]|uniref:VOC domain-containing protein n=1 Tax=Thalassovita taeanensis TaxID=657014 RepID=A0A1H9AN84_9RHOB|nr:VOC family protein [Thalassovita taeanensis]SEP78160.1 hypothetical protein SAMN04488092_102201 [Thalassovita taeanensis]